MNLQHSTAAPFSGGGEFLVLTTLYFALAQSKVQEVAHGKLAPCFQQTARLVQKSEEKKIEDILGFKTIQP